MSKQPISPLSPSLSKAQSLFAYSGLTPDCRDGFGDEGDISLRSVMSGFKSPNHTQVPNELFDIYLKDIGDAELRVTLCIIRQTLGWHRDRTRYSIGNITRATGLSWNGAQAGAEAAEKRGLIKRIPNSSPAEWELMWDDTPSPIEGALSEVPQPVRDTPSASEGETPQPVRDLKERKKLIKEKEEEAAPATFSYASLDNSDNIPGSDRIFERIWQNVTSMSTFLSSKDKDIPRIEAVYCRNNRNLDKTVADLKLYYNAWISTVSKKTNTKYSRQNTGWLDWAVAGEVNGNGASERKLTDMERIEKILSDAAKAEVRY